MTAMMIDVNDVDYIMIVGVMQYLLQCSSDDKR